MNEEKGRKGMSKEKGRREGKGRMERGGGAEVVGGKGAEGNGREGKNREGRGAGKGGEQGREAGRGRTRHSRGTYFVSNSARHLRGETSAKLVSLLAGHSECGIVRPSYMIYTRRSQHSE